jgi:hypothetical protein
MSKHFAVASGASAALLLSLVFGAPAQPGSGMMQAPAAGPEQPIYGSQLITPEERAQYQIKMRSLQTQAERDALRQEHHKQMDERAKQMGVRLPEGPPTSGGMMGPGGGGMMGPGGGGMMGLGGGMRGGQ